MRPGGVIMQVEGTNEPNGILLEDEGVSIIANNERRLQLRLNTLLMQF